MTGDLGLDWAGLAVSLFNTIALLWLGLTVLFNADRLSWGMALTVGSLLMGAGFFLIHSAILGLGLEGTAGGLEWWWQAGWISLVLLPFAWYGVILWYAGFWEASESSLRRRHRLGFALTVVLAVVIAGLLLFADPVPSFLDLIRLNLAASPSVFGLPLLLVVYPGYIALCIALSLDVLRRPGPSRRIMGALARRRARPWLVGTSLVLLAVSLLVTGALGWALNLDQVGPLTSAMIRTAAWLDLVIASLIGLAVVMLGQAVVSYEVFTGKALPRGGSARQWRRVLILAAGYGGVVGWGLAARLNTIYSLLLTTVIMTVFFALLSWRTYGERERIFRQLRPFVTSQRLYERLVAPASSPASEREWLAPFEALCQEVLSARRAYLIAVGPLSPLAGPPMTYPVQDAVPPPRLEDLPDAFDTPETLSIPLNPADRDGLRWMIPLWSERGPIGVLLLGEKLDGGLYTQEEIEIARSVGERLVDARASAQIALRLMALQRESYLQSQVVDRRTRRVLHDDVLPQLHAALLAVSALSTESSQRLEAIRTLEEVHREIADLLRNLPALPVPATGGRGLVAGLEDAVQEMEAAFDWVAWQVEPDAVRRAERLPGVAVEVVYYAAREAIRNAARHGRGGDPGRDLHLRIALTGERDLRLVIEDDGCGVAPAGENAGAGAGLALHGTMMAVVGGSLILESDPGAFTRVILTLPFEPTSPRSDTEEWAPSSP